MTHRVLPLWVLAASLSISLVSVAVAQSRMQQATGSSSSIGSGRNTSGASGAVPGLSIVPTDFVKLKLAPGFMLSLNVLDDSDFTGSFRIDENGDIFVPILGTIHVAGETASEARAQIRQKLVDDQILRDPQVTLNVVEYTAPTVTIVGEVTSPGKYTLLAPQRLVDVLALAGGLTVTASNEVLITRDSLDSEPVLVHYSKTTSANAVEGIIVQPGDTVQVKRAGIVYVLGAVARPGGYVMEEQGALNVLQAMSLAGGTGPTASIGTIYLLRRNADGSVVYLALPYKKMIQGKSADVQLHATDILFISSSTIKSIFANTQQIINSAATSAIYRF